MKPRRPTGGAPSIADLFPTLTEVERGEAEERLDRYVAIALRIHERVRSDPDAYRRFRSLTERRKRSTIADTASQTATGPSLPPDP